MSLGFAAAAWIPPEPPILIVAADSRISFRDSGLTDDTGVKTYELGGRSAMVAAGHALPALLAAQIVRPIVENHNRHNAGRHMGFYDITRLLSFFLKRIAKDQNAACEVAVAGFLSSGAPALAYVIVSPDRNRVIFSSINVGEKIALPVGGHPDASNLLMQGLAAAKEEGKPMLGSGLCLLWYIAQHRGAFPSIGGGISVGTCDAPSESFSWPIVEFAGRRFLHGVDVTAAYRPTWPRPLVAPYDEAWCADLDQRVATAERLVIPSHANVTGYDIDEMSSPETLFQTHDDPHAFEDGVPSAQ